MKKVLRGFVVMLICTIVTVCMPVINISAEEADFTMTDSTMNVLASDILAKGTFAGDPEKFDRAVYPGPETDPTGQILWHSGNGDTFTFDVDFGNYAVSKMTYNHGGPSMTLNVYADGVLVGSGDAPEASRDVAANKCVISLNTVLSGVKTIKLEVVSDTVVWPGTDYGYFTFYQDSLVMTDEIWNLKSSDILVYGTFAGDPEKFDRAVYPEPETDPTGQILWHSGNGDTFTFDVDFGDYTVTKITYNHGGPSMTLNVYADGVLIGSGDAPEASRDVDANMCTILLSTALTGTKTIKLEVVSDTVVWPGTDYGKFIFYSEKGSAETAAPTETASPEVTPGQNNSNTGDSSVLPYAIIAIIAVSAVTLMIVLKRKEV